jgi:hypothetical protein
MDLLESLGALVVAVVGSVVGSFFFLRARVRGQLAYHRAAGVHRFPQRLSLKRMEPFAWRKLSRGPQRVEAFHSLGFEDLAGFTVDEIPGARLFALQHPATGLLGLVNEHEQLGTWSDVLLFQHGERQPILASSILKHVHFFLLPGSPKIHKRDAAEQELMAAVLTAAGRDVPERGCPSRSRFGEGSARVDLKPGEQDPAPQLGQLRSGDIPLTTVEFVRLYEDAFADAIDQRLLEPWDDSELRRLLREQSQPCCGEQLTDEEFARIKSQYPAAVANELRLVCMMQFVRETALPASQWQEARERILVIHDRTPLRELTRRRIYGAYLTSELKKRLRRHANSKPPRESFNQFNTTLPPWERYKMLGQVARPVPADIYRAPIPRKAA